ncbi:hypothetical protein G9F72_023860 [Clostridium estertheticum]|uniref:hypothetical protein n=1 Tax=Clostridium estertheticum TaxID=238834 RepID=UPI0013E99BD1|nr:hypothetical protein [Clostridium estertheticum]MBZ9689336.1 hypothetical protein [Clostridium estertheticum]
MNKKKKKRKRKVKHNVVQTTNGSIRNVIQYLTKIYDKYGILVAWFPVIMLILMFIIGVAGFVIVKRVDSPIVWVCISYVLIFGLKNKFITVLDSSKYAKSYQLMINIVKLILCYLMLPTILTILTMAFKPLDTKVLFIIPVINYIGFKFLTSISISYNSYNGLSKKTFWISVTCVLVCVLIQTCILITLFLNLSLYEYIYFKFTITKVSIFIFTTLNLVGNIIILILTLLKTTKIKNWREITIGSTLYRYKHVRGEVKQILKEGIGGTFFPVPKYTRYNVINNFNNFDINLDWTRLSNKLYKRKEPDSTEMMVNNEFISNPLFRMYNITLNWNVRYARVFRSTYLLIGVLFNQRGIYLLYKTGNPIDSNILIAWGTLLIWLAIFGYIILVSRPHKFRNLKVIFVIVLFLYNIGNIIIHFDIYSKVLPFDIFIFLYFYSSYRFISNKVKKDCHYKYFNVVNM